MAGLSTKDELFAIRLLELARHLEPAASRVEFVRRCERHGIRCFLQGHPEVWQQVTDNPPREGITPDQEHRVRCAGFALKAAVFQERLIGELENSGVRVLALKGLSLSKLLYGDIAEREFGDVDLLVSFQDAAKANAVLDSVGLRRTYPSGLAPGQQAAFFRYGKAQNFSETGGAVSVDLHWRLVSPWVGSDLMPFEELWARRQTLEREGLRPWSTLGDADTLVFLALHGFQDGWPSLKQFLDLAVALEVLDYDWSEVLAIAGYRRVVVERAIELCVRLLGVPHPNTMTHSYRDYHHALEEWERLALAGKTPQRKLLAANLWSCHPSEALRRSVSALFWPAIDDIKSVKLPAGMSFFYPLVRFFRLLKKAFDRREFS